MKNSIPVRHYLTQVAHTQHTHHNIHRYAHGYAYFMTMAAYSTDRIIRLRENTYLCEAFRSARSH